jgi:hypothetical protein
MPALRVRTAAWIVLLLSTSPAASPAATWNVPADAATIQSAVGLAATGDTVEVEPGTYVGPGNRDIDFGGKDLVLRSVVGAPATILDCQGAGRGLVFQSGEGNAAVVEGFTIRNGRVARGGAIFCHGASPTIVDCVLSMNRADETGGAVSTLFGATPRLVRCRIESNDALFSGGGISCIDASAEITDCVVSDNEAGLLGGGIYCRNASPTIHATHFVDNRSNGAGGGVVFYHLSAPMVTQCIVAGNHSAGSGGAAFCDDQASPTFVDCLVTGNHTDGQGGAILITSRSVVVLRGSTLAGNRALNRGGGLHAEGVSRFELERSILWGNCAGIDDEAHLFDAASQATFTCSAVDSSGIGGPGTTSHVANDVFADPMFCAPLDCGAAPTSLGDHRLQSSSRASLPRAHAGYASERGTRAAGWWRPPLPMCGRPVPSCSRPVRSGTG